jgi:hypothetical protein
MEFGKFWVYPEGKKSIFPFVGVRVLFDPPLSGYLEKTVNDVATTQRSGRRLIGRGTGSDKKLSFGKLPFSAVPLRVQSWTSK